MVHTIPACKDIVKEGMFGNMNRVLWRIGCSLRVDKMSLQVAFMDGFIELFASLP